MRPLNLKKQSILALSYLLIIASLGVLLRLLPVSNMNINYRYIVHAHSHIALLGWVYTALMVLIYYLYLKDTQIKQKYAKVFWFTQFTIIGMLFSFPFTGYALISIIFSSLFIIASYVFAILVFKHTPSENKNSHAYKCIKIALWYMIISSIGPWALGIIMNTLGSSSSWYRNAIYFYLHFQYSGWFILALFGVFFHILDAHKVSIKTRVFKQFYLFFNVGVILTFGTSILWMEIDNSINLISALGGCFQIAAFYILLKALLNQKQIIKGAFTKIFKLILKTLVIFLSFKLLLQVIGTFPNISKTISLNIDFIIGYIHWVFLGVVSTGLIGFLYYFKLIKLTRRSIAYYIAGFLLMECAIFYKGLSIWQDLYLPGDNLIYLLIVSSIFTLAIFNIFFLQVKRTK